MAECTNQDLRKARDAAKLTRWQAAHQLGVSEETVRRWETGEVIPHPDDVGRMEEAYHAKNLWFRWMRSNIESYRDRFPEVADYTLPISLVSAKFEIGDVLPLIDSVTRDAMDGKIDNPGDRDRLIREIDEAIAAMMACKAELQR